MVTNFIDAYIDGLVHDCIEDTEDFPLSHRYMRNQASSALAITTKLALWQPLFLLWKRTSNLIYSIVLINKRPYVYHGWAFILQSAIRDRKTSSISRTKSQNLNVSHIVLQLSLLNPLKPNVKLIMKMLLEQRRQAMLQLHLSYQQFYCLLRCDLH